MAEFISHASTAPTMSLGSEAFSILAEGHQTGGQLACVEVWVPPGGGPPLHRHDREDEAFYVLEGTLTLIVGDQAHSLRPGSFAWAPRRLRHRFTNQTASPVRMLVFMLPSGMDAMFRASSIPLKPGTRIAAPPDQASIDRFLTACAAHGVDLNPSPDGDRPETPAYTLDPAAAETISMVGDVYRLLATGQRSGGRFYLHDAIVPPGGGPPPHSHSREDEAFYIISGTLTFEVEGRRLLAPEGSFVWAPRSQRHRFFNDTKQTVRCLVMALPAGIESMFRAAGAALPPGSTTPAPVSDQDIALVLASARAHGIDI